MIMGKKSSKSGYKDVAASKQNMTGAEERHGQVLSGNQPQGREHHEQVVLQRCQSHEALRKGSGTWMI
jgi:hypothetical protein